MCYDYPIMIYIKSIRQLSIGFLSDLLCRHCGTQVVSLNCDTFGDTVFQKILLLNICLLSFEFLIICRYQLTPLNQGTSLPVLCTD